VTGYRDAASLPPAPFADQPHPLPICPIPHFPAPLAFVASSTRPMLPLLLQRSSTSPAALHAAPAAAALAFVARSNQACLDPSR
jgi:hypothetical protein